MAMPPQSENFQFPHPSFAGNRIPDERDAYISWLLGEFTAANTIIDCLCQQLQTAVNSYQYESLVASVNLRRFTWAPYMNYNSDQVGKFGGMITRPGFNKHHHGGYKGAESVARNVPNYNSDCASVSSGRVENREVAKLASDDKALYLADEKRDGREKPKSDSKVGGTLKESETQVEKVNHNCNSASQDNNSLSSMAKTFVVREMYEGRMVNVVEGLKLYEQIIDAKEVSQLVSLANNMRVSGRRGQLQSEAYAAYKRPNRGHGREMIQLGLPIADIPPGNESIKDRRIEPIPSVLVDIIERLVSKQIIHVKPDVCIIDFFNEGDYSQPHMYVPWFGRPVGVLSLSECNVTFGRVIVSDQQGDYKGSLKLSLIPGSVLLVEGESADLAKYAIHSTGNPRIFITFTKSHQPPPIPRIPIPGTGVFLPPNSTREQVSQVFPETLTVNGAISRIIKMEQREERYPVLLIIISSY